MKKRTTKRRRRNPSTAKRTRWLPAIAGFFLGPSISGAVARVVVRADTNRALCVAHGAGAVAYYLASERVKGDGLRSFCLGAMWGELPCVVLAGASRNEEPIVTRILAA